MIMAASLTHTRTRQAAPDLRAAQAASAPTHSWLVVGPWWTWPKHTDPLPREGARTTRPVLQKYADSQLVERFLTDPQDSLRFLDAEDRVRVDHLLRRPLLAADPATGRRHLRRTASVTTPIRKLYRDTHQRFYLVACSVHCDRPGLPRVRRDDVVRAEFVIRRRRYPEPHALDADQRAELTRLLDEKLTAELTHQEQVSELVRRLTGLPLDDSIMPALTEATHAQGVLALARARLAELGEMAAGPPVIDRWATGPSGEPAQWRRVDRDLGQGVETSYPLYPLVPPQTDSNHDGTHGSIWFGLVPTGSDETEPTGQPRFVPSNDLEIRCVVHRRNPTCPDRTDRSLPVWSAPTEPYRLASHTDPLGSANRQVTLPTPDLAQLRAQAEIMSRPSDLGFPPGPGRLASARVEQPAGSRYRFPSKDDQLPSTGQKSDGGEEQCFVAIPLITFVAMFLLQIFLPILLFLMNLWWMLQLKFCVPGRLSIDVDLSADIVSRPGPDGFELDDVADFEADAEAGGLTPEERELVKDAVDRQLSANFTTKAIHDIKDQNSLQEQWQLLRNIQIAQDQAAAGSLRTGGAALPVTRVEWHEVGLR